MKLNEQLDLALLYGYPGAEHLHLDLEDAIVEQWDGGPPPDEDKPIIIEEWTTYPASHHLPLADTLLEWMSEQVAMNGEVSEDAAEQWADACAKPDVKAAAEALLALIASKVTYLMASKHVATWTFPPGTEDDPPPIETGVREPTGNGEQ